MNLDPSRSHTAFKSLSLPSVAAAASRGARLSPRQEETVRALLARSLSGGFSSQDPVAVSPEGAATILGGGSAEPRVAAWTNARAIRRSDCAHPGADFVAPALAAAEAIDGSGEQLLAAIALGSQARASLRAAHPELDAVGATAVGATLAAASALALDEEEVVRALGLCHRRLEGLATLGAEEPPERELIPWAQAIGLGAALRVWQDPFVGAEAGDPAADAERQLARDLKTLPVLEQPALRWSDASELFSQHTTGALPSAQRGVVLQAIAGLGHLRVRHLGQLLRSRPPTLVLVAAPKGHL